MFIKGLQKTTLLDYPGKVACTIFTGGCNFRCPFCHNASLVTRIDSEERIDEDELFSYLEKRKGILDGVCITGGEPLLQPDIEAFCQKIKKLGLLIKLDTNGSFPTKLRSLLDANLIDYIAMDIKNSKKEYAKTCGIREFPQNVEESIRIIRSASVPYEFRTTVVRELHTKESVRALAEWIAGADRYFLQGFIDSGDLIENNYSAYSEAEMRELLAIARVYVPTAELRGV